MKTNCLICDGELMTVDQEINGVITKVCKECGFVTSFFNTKIRMELVGKAVKSAEDDGKGTSKSGTE